MVGIHKISKTLLINMLKSGTDVVYSTMYPTISPDFLTQQEVVEWYRSQPDWSKAKFVKLGYLAIYEHKIAKKDGLTDVGHEYVAGQVLETNEVQVFDFTKKNWL